MQLMFQSHFYHNVTIFAYALHKSYPIDIPQIYRKKSKNNIREQIILALWCVDKWAWLSPTSIISPFWESTRWILIIVRQPHLSPCLDLTDSFLLMIVIKCLSLLIRVKSLLIRVKLHNYFMSRGVMTLSSLASPIELFVSSSSLWKSSHFLYELHPSEQD